MSFPRYPEYKDSGVEWLGEVPGHWQVQRLANLFRQVAEDGRDDLPVLTVSIHSGVSDKEFDDNELDRKVTRIEDRTSYKRVAPGDLVYNMMRAWQGGFGTVTVAGLVSPAYVVARPIKRISTFLVEQQLRTPAAVEEMRRHSRGVTDFRLRLYWEEFKTLSVVVPPPIEEAAIAAFLDRETAKIDALVAEQQNLIALLKEKRQALISHAVTKGLDPDVPMKDSGVAWLGEVPAHWVVKALKNVILRLQSGVSVNAIDTPAAEGEIGVLKTSCVYGGWFDPAENKAVLPEECERVACPVTAGTLIVSRMNTPDLVGAAGIVRESHPELFLPDRLWQVYFADANAAFIHYWTHSPLYRAQVQQVCAGTSSSMQNLSQDQFRAFSLALPPEREQKAIAAFLDRETLKLDELVTQAASTIDLLQERRTALISAAVTGKIDVRHLAVVPADRTPEPA